MKSKNVKKKSSTKEKILMSIFVIIITASVVCVAGVFIMNTKFFKNTDSGNKSDNLNENIATPEDIKEKNVNFLIAGIDYLAGSGRGKLTDVVMVVSFDIEGKKINVLQIPRDTYIGNDYPTGKINAIYGQKNNGGIEGLANRINKTLNISIDHYVTLNMDGFKNIIDKIGGVQVDVPKQITLEGITIKKGSQVLDGITAEKFVRERHSYANADLGRLEAQKLFMKALIEKVFSMGKAKIATLAPSLIGDITTDLTLGKMLGYYGKVLTVNRDEINFHLIPIVGGGWNGKVSVLSIMKYPTADMLNEYFRPYTEKIGAEDLGVIELVKDYKYEKPTSSTKN